MKTKSAGTLASLSLSILACGALLSGASARACTDFCYSQGDTVLAGRSLDTPVNYPHLGMLLVPATATTHGWVCFGPFEYPWADGMNDQGLFVGFAAVPAPYTSTSSSQPADHQTFHSGLLANCATVDEAIAWCSQQPTPNLSVGLVNQSSPGHYTFVTSSHIMVADRSGDSVVFEWPQGKLKTTRKRGRYQLMTNFLLTDPEAGSYPCPRYIADSRIFDKAAGPSLQTCRQVLETTSVGSTRYSLIYDLTHGDVHVYLRRRFDQPKTIHLADELQKGRHELDLDQWFGRPEPEPLSPPPVIASSTIPAAEILQRALAARGGGKAAAEIRSLHGKGTIDLGWGCLPASPVDYFAMRPNRFRAVTDIGLPGDPHPGQYVEGFDGRTGWNDYSGSCNILQGQEYELRKDGAAFFGWYDEPDNNETAECLGEAQFDGKLCYDLKVVSPSSHLEYFEYYDATNFLLAGAFAPAATPGRPSWVKTTFGDYRAFDGFMIPTRIVSQDDDMGCYPLQFSSVEINTVKEKDLRMTKKVSRLLAALPAAAETAEARSATTLLEKADALLDGLIKTNDPGLAVLVAQNGKVLFEKGYGLADREHGVPVTPQTTFRIGSITKQFTAAAILKLREEGKLSVKDKLSKYIPDFPRGDEVTLRHLLNHTSGIHDYLEDPGFWSHTTNATTTEAIVEEIKKYPYDFDPGTKWSYDNSGYRLLGSIVEKVSGQSYGDFLRENFFQPLGMTNTGVYRAHPGLPHEALGYSLGTNGFTRALWDPSWSGGDGALYSTVEDLYRWNEGIFNGRVLDAASLKATFTPVKKKVSQLNSGNGYGFGWFIGRDRGLREISHGGGIPGFTSILLRLPDEKFTVAVLANAMPGRPEANPGSLGYQMVDIYLADKLAPLAIVNTNVSPKSYDALTGRYDMGNLGDILISRRGTHLFLQHADEPEVEIFPKSKTEFFWKGGEDFIPIMFVKDSSGMAVKVIDDYYGMEFAAPRAKESAEAKVEPAVYDSLVGKYDYGNGAVLTVTRDGNHLFAQLTGQPKFEIFPKSETEYFWKVVDAQVTFVKDAAGKVTKAIHHQDGQTIDAPKIQ